jgi:hypothetical protein
MYLRIRALKAKVPETDAVGRKSLSSPNAIENRFKAMQLVEGA